MTAGPVRRSPVGGDVVRVAAPELLRDLAYAAPPVTGHTAAEVFTELQAARLRVIAERCVMARLCSLQARRMSGRSTNSNRTTFVRSGVNCWVN